MSRKALIVANDQYRDPGLRSLFAPRHDAQALRELLREPQIGNFEPAELLVNESKAEIERAMEHLFRSAVPGDLVLLYFSGHGVRSRKGRLHLAVGNTELSLLAATSISASFMKELIDESDASSKVVLLDCCYSGAFTDEGLKSDRQLDVGQELLAGRGAYVITASSPIERADDGRPGGAEQTLSAFTEAVVRGISTGEADMRAIGRITPTDLWEYVRMEVPRRTSSQTPTQYGFAEEEVDLAWVRRDFAQPSPGSGQRVYLGDLLGRLTVTPDEGLRADDLLAAGPLTLPVGQVFRGQEAAGKVWMNLAGQDGHLLAVGKIGTGKSTLLRTMVLGLTLTNPPGTVRFYFLESGGNKLGSLRRLPFPITMARDDEVDAIRDLLDELDGIVAARKRLYSEHFIDSAEEFRVHRQSLPDQSHPDIFLMIDRLPDFLPYLDRIQALAGVGLEYAVHVVVTARSWREVPETLAELIHCKIELNLDSPQESRLNPQLAQRHVNDAPGWAIRRDSRFLIALPHLGSAGGAPPEAISLSGPDGARELVDRITAAWPETGREAPAVKRDVAPLTVAPTVLELLGIEEISAAALKRFRSAVTDPERLRVPFAVDSRNSPVLLDLKEAAQGGMGPHGLLVGATGSGKSELLRTLVTALALKHDSQTINFVLIDLKGGATFSGLSRLPHLAALVTNLVDDLSLVDRVVAVLEGEMVRRQELLRRSGSWASHRDYEKARRDGVALQPLPSLLVICDEFSELLAARPDFFDLFIQISRLGRSLGIHLLLSGQRLEEGRLRGLGTYLSYRIALRTFSALESRAVLDVPDAYELPRTPGHGLLRVGTEPVRRLLTATTFRSMPGEQETMLSTAESVAEFLSAADAPARSMWLPPLDVSPTLDEVLGPAALVAERGITCADPALRGSLRVPIALVDKPRRHERDVLWLELAGAAGHVAIVGSAASGKSTAMRSMICGLALTHTPAEVQVYCLDFGGGSLSTLRDLPHVGGVFGRIDRDGVRRTVGEISTLLAERETRFASMGIDSMASYRLRRPAGTGDQPAGDVFLFVDGWATLRKEFEELEPVITDIATRGLSYGIHVVASTSRWMDFRPVIRDLFGSKLELRLGDPTDSLVNRRAAMTVPQKPGRGIVEQPAGNESLHLLTVRPELSSMGDTAALVKVIATNWPGPAAPRVRMLPASVPYSELDVGRSPGLRLPIGIAEADLRQVEIDFAADPHFLLFGDAECGKTSFLRSLATSITRKFTPDQARMIVVDYRRGLFDMPESEHRIGYGVQAQGTLELMQSVAGSMQRRLPGPDVTAQQLRDRSWWTGPELFVLVDDYDLVVAGSTNPLTPLLEYLPQARDLGLHLVVARRSGGASRALFEPVIQRLRELSAPGLVMSGSPDEGALIGAVRPAPSPPGRGWLVTRLEDVRLIQLAYLPPDS